MQISDRIEAFREAERHLLEFAKTRFAHRAHQKHGHEHHNIVYESNHHFELFDTPIKVPSVIKDDAISCQVHLKKNDGYVADDEDNNMNYSLHGVKVINKRLSSLLDDNIEESTPSPAPSKQQQQQQAAAPLVLLHGYANGSLYFYRNLMGLSQYFGRVYALDMLGWGMSSRPKFDLLSVDDHEGGSRSTTSSMMNSSSATKNNEDDKDEQQKVVSAAESFFVESLESWRQTNNLPKMTLAGHSMGGYLSVAYAEKYPQHVEKLILLSPVGVPEKRPEDESRINSLPFYIRGMIQTSRYLFNKGVTPGAFLRSLPYTKSKAVVDGYILNRLPAITCPDERKHLSEYLYQNSMLPGSGECCLSDILTAGAFAKIPLVHRIPKLQSGMEVHCIYGQNDWMDYKGGLDVQRLCHEKQNKSNNASPPPSVYVHGVKDASHLLMLDNYEEFNAAIIIASGNGDNLPSSMPRPMQFVCDEVLESSTSSAAAASSRSMSINNTVLGEQRAAEFFRGPTYRKKLLKKQMSMKRRHSENGAVKEEAVENANEEKKVDEQQLA